MTVHGHIWNGVVVLDENANLPDGTEVRVELPETVLDATTPAPNGTTLAQKLLALAGQAKGLPSDASVNLDHYLYGTPKR